MANDTLTIALNGDVALGEFAAAMGHFNTLVSGLSKEIAGDTQIEWVIDNLESGSAIATVKAVTERADLVGSIVSAFSKVGKALHAREPIPYSEAIRKPAQALTDMLNGKITSIRFETPEADYIIPSHYPADGTKLKEPAYSFGSLKGVVQTLSRRRGVRFTLYDAIFDRPIACYLREGQEDLVRNYWGKKVLVSGRIGRDVDTGKPFAVRDVISITPVRVSEPGSYRKARGILELSEGDTPEKVIRRLRDG